jgi:hypothetical protein
MGHRQVAQYTTSLGVFCVCPSMGARSVGIGKGAATSVLHYTMKHFQRKWWILGIGTMEWRIHARVRSLPGGGFWGRGGGGIFPGMGDFCRLMAGKPMSRYCRSGVVCLSVTIVHCGQTAINRIMISTQTDRASTWLRQAPNSVEIGLAVFEQWRT